MCIHSSKTDDVNDKILLYYHFVQLWMLCNIIRHRRYPQKYYEFWHHPHLLLYVLLNFRAILRKKMIKLNYNIFILF